MHRSLRTITLGAAIAALAAAPASATDVSSAFNAKEAKLCIDNASLPCTVSWTLQSAAETADPAGAGQPFRDAEAAWYSTAQPVANTAACILLELTTNRDC